MGPLGRKVVTANFERRGRRSKGGWGSQLFDPMVPLFWFWPLPEPIDGFGRRSKGWGPQLFDPMEPEDEKFWVWPLPEPIFGLNWRPEGPLFLGRKVK